MWAAESSLTSLREAGKKTKVTQKKKNFTLRHVVENSGQLSRRVQRRIVPQIKRAALEHFISDYILGRGHSFSSDIYSWNPPIPKYPPFSEAPWLPVCAEAPPATLEKPGASDLH